MTTRSSASLAGLIVVLLLAGGCWSIEDKIFAVTGNFEGNGEVRVCLRSLETSEERPLCSAAGEFRCACIARTGSFTIRLYDSDQLVFESKPFDMSHNLNLGRIVARATTPRPARHAR